MNCTSCAQELPAGARFCPGCGTPAAAAPARPVVDERRLVTLVFCDLVGSTALSGRLDPEALRSVTLRYFELMTARIEAHGGTVEKFIGDAVMAVFGIPVLHEDDARRALAATLDMRTALAGLNAELEAALGIRLNVRIGVNTGEAVASTDASSRQALVSGEVVNIAARLEQNAGPGEILIGPDTLRAVGPAARTEDAGLLTLKGKAEPFPAYRLLGLHEDAPELLRRFDTPFIGRSLELAVLENALAIGRRGSGLLTVAGEAGIGKTRLLREWLRRTTPRYGAGRCRPYGESGSLAPLAEAVRQLLGPGPAGPEVPPALRAGLLRDGTPSPTVADTCAALGELFAGFAPGGPTVLILDDFHWAGPALREAVARLATGPGPVLVVCAARPELVERVPEWADTGRLIPLPGLSPTESHRLAAGLAEVTAHTTGPVEVTAHGAGLAAAAGRTDAGTGGPRPTGSDAAGALLASLVERAEGNPLHLEQLYAMAADGRDPGELPPTVHALLGARIDALAAPERTALSLAAVVGREFERGELTGLARSGPEGRAGGELAPDAAGLDSVRPTLHRLTRRRLVEADQDEARYRFSSGLVQEVSYQGMAKRVRADRHERVAELLTDRGAGDATLGGHLARAYRYRAQLGTLDPHTERLRHRAAAHLAAAGAQALARADLGWADELLTGAVELAREEDPGWLTTAWRLAEVRLATGRVEEGRALLLRVAGAADPVLAAHARLGLAVLDPGPGLADAARTAEQVLPLFEAAGEELGQARACLRLAQHQQVLGRHGTADRLLDRALAHAVRAGAEPERAAALGAVGVSLWLGPLPVPAAVERCRALLAEHGADRRAVRITLNCPLAVLLALREDWAGARQCLAEAAALGEELGFAEALVFLPVFRAAVEALAGRPSRAAELLRAVERTCRDLGAVTLLPAITRDLTRALLDAGDSVDGDAGDNPGGDAGDNASRAAGADAIEAAAAGAGEADPAAADAADLHGSLARLHALAGRATAADRAAARAVAEAAGTDSPVVRATAALDRAHAALALGRPAEAASWAEQAHHWYRTKGHLPGLRRAAALLGTDLSAAALSPETRHAEASAAEVPGPEHPAAGTPTATAPGTTAPGAERPTRTEESEPR
ncbi:Adenylate/guanylate cyclase [Kitasatospora sp. MMS16-BH015]|uniref:adenylate/guanylate cyclase domain-containing protein n=1 Tax=Kitasatospora sp. MMS16-BH015 TaxID=2018025 RepID=UPI000CA1D5CE|nr:adenylate/guanylate cyclase domain-containing protein [Kitasatospora sp. MMS16-BH015]AUG78987.1 Adenylate/guanylate cyclase [Kitasatospora sp. MMS16-BH015]